MIHTINATLIHFKQSKLSPEYIIDQQKGCWAILMLVQSYFHPFFNVSPKSIKKSSFIQMRCLRETRLKIHFYLRPIPQFLRNLGATILKYA